jgi:hypothetical protein
LLHTGHLLVVWIPERRRRRIIRNNITAEYRLFKESVIPIFLRACQAGGGDCDIRKTSQLTEQDTFRKYFKERISEYKDRWQAVASGLDEKLLRDLLVELV